MDEALAELTDYFRRWCEPPDTELVRLAAAARAAGCRWEAIAAACDTRDDPDPAAVVYSPYGLIPGQGAGPCSASPSTPYGSSQAATAAATVR